MKHYNILRTIAITGIMYSAISGYYNYKQSIISESPREKYSLQQKEINNVNTGLEGLLLLGLCFEKKK